MRDEKERNEREKSENLVRPHDYLEPKESIVIDTNVLISAIRNGSPSRMVVDHAIKEYNVVYSDSTMKEFENVAGRKNIVSLFGKNDIIY